jgi:rubrerythrin
LKIIINKRGLLMKSLQNTRTADYLMKAFAGESQARNRYTFYASAAKKEGYVQIQNIFLETAANEKEHAERFFKFLKDGLTGGAPFPMEVNATYPVALGNTLENLKAAAGGEHEEWSDLYPSFADIADEEGFPEIASVFRAVMVSEKQHEARYNKLAANIESGKVFVRDGEVYWKCGNCGYIHKGTEAPETCPACAHAKAYFELLCEPY